MTRPTARTPEGPPRLLALSVEWLGIIVFALIAGQFLAALLSLLLGPQALTFVVFVPTPVVVFLLLSFRLKSEVGQLRWPGAAGLWWSLAAMVPAAWFGGLAGGWIYQRVVPCVGDCSETSAPIAGSLTGASLLGLTVLFAVFVWRAKVAAGRAADV